MERTLMPDDLDDLDLDDEDGTGLVRRLRQDLRDTKKQLKDRDDSAEENARLKREIAFRDVGLDLSNPTAKFFADHYDGDPSAEAVKASATAIGILKDETPDAAAQLEEMQKAAALAAGAPAPGSVENAQAEREAAYLTAKSPEEVVQMMQKMGSPSAPPSQF